MGRRVPVIVVTGYLGAGKTTLLNRLLLRPGGRVGVIVNDFGAVNVDAGLIIGQVDQVGSIAGGCLCCLDDVSGLDDALARLTHPRLALDAVVIEASGIAEPGALARLIRYSGVEAVRPGGVVDVVDAANYFATVDDAGSAPPVRFTVASLVVINKCDLLDTAVRDDVLARIEARIRQANPATYVVRTTRGQIDPAPLFDVATPHDPEDQLPIAALQRRQHHEHMARHDSGQTPGRDPSGDTFDHAHAASVTVEVPGPVEPAAILELLENPPRGAYRIKGTICVDVGRSRRGYVVQVVGRHPFVARTPQAPPVSQVVGIGVDLDVDATRKRLATAVAPAGRSSVRGLQRLEQARRLSE
ncbi:MAG TPA: GTP-binding protein [Acidimicrobiales bacterium]|nr:GTP-binding protein [Acidimicrobiales bacterium]